MREFYGIAIAVTRDSIGNLNGFAYGGDDVAQMADLEKTDAASTRPRVSRHWRMVVDIVFIISTAIGAIPVAEFGIDDGMLLMFVAFYSILIFIVGLRDYAATLLGVDQTYGKPLHWLTPAKSSLVIAIFLALLLGAAWAISRLLVSDRIRVVLLLGTAALVWALFRRLGQPWLCYAGPTSCAR